MALKDVKGQNRAVDILLRTLGRGRMPSAYLFTGESGIGKRFAALNLAKALNCLRNRDALSVVSDESGENTRLASSDSYFDFDACDGCSSCKKIDAGTHPDVVVIAPEKGEIRVDEIRTVEDALSFRPFEGRKKVVLVDDAETMNQSAANAFLKTLEEPPEDSLIVLVASNSDRLPETIRSRCSRVRFSPLSSSACTDVIRTVFDKLPRDSAREKKRQEPVDLRLSEVVKLSMGRPGRAVSSDLLKERERFLALLESMVGNGGETWVDREEMELWLDMVLVVLRDVMILKTTGSAAMLVNEDIGSTLSGMSRKADLRAVIELYGLINRLKEKIDFNLNKAITWNYTASIVRRVMAHGS